MEENTMSSVKKIETGIVERFERPLNIVWVLLVYIGAFGIVYVVGVANGSIKKWPLSPKEISFLGVIGAMLFINLLIYIFVYNRRERHSANTDKHVAYLSLCRLCLPVGLVILVLIIGVICLHIPQISILKKNYANANASWPIALAVVAILNGSVFFIFKPRP